MDIFRNMPAASIIVVVVILGLFAAAVVMLFMLCATYRRHMKLAVHGDTYRSRVLAQAVEDYSEAYKSLAEETNTPAIINSAIQNNLGLALFCERFLNNAVSLFVTLGLFGTFLGLSMSVASLTELLSFNTGSDWQIVLNSVGDGLMSALSGMGVAFYTSLVGVACSIILTVLRAIFNPESARAGLENEMELWLDHRTAPTLPTERISSEADLIRRVTVGLNSAASTMEKALSDSTRTMETTMDGFSTTVDSFNKGVKGVAEFDYNLRGTVERMDIAVRDLTAAIRRITEGGNRS